MTNVLEAFWISIFFLGVNFRHFMKNISKGAFCHKFSGFEEQLLLQLSKT